MRIFVSEGSVSFEVNELDEVPDTIILEGSHFTLKEKDTLLTLYKCLDEIFGNKSLPRI